jgi:hypothetical protein
VLGNSKKAVKGATPEKIQIKQIINSQKLEEKSMI